MDRPINILVTGCGGDIGQSIVKILRSFTFVNNIIGCDIHNKHPGIFLVDIFKKVCRVDNENYRLELDSLIEKNSIDLVIPLSEAELRWHNRYGIFNDYIKHSKIRCLLPSTKALKVGLDKLDTALFLKKHGLPYLHTEIAEIIMNPTFPCILKNRFGAGSKELFVVNNEEELDFYRQKFKDLIYQEHVSDMEGEFTCGLFRFNDQSRIVIFKRELHGGYSGYGEVKRNLAIENLLIELGNKLELNGSINIQLRLKNGIPMIFEINPRFSSTVLFRHLLGFEDLKWTIESVFNKELSDFVAPLEGKKFYKGFMEYLS